jgi:hypothetical protein
MKTAGLKMLFQGYGGVSEERARNPGSMGRQSPFFPGVEDRRGPEQDH